MLSLRPSRAFLLAMGLAVTVAAQAEERQRFTGAFVTMTPGARCPSASTVAFTGQGEATGPLSGLFDLKGTLELALHPMGTGAVLRAFSAGLDINQRQVTGSLQWDERDGPLALSCDPLSLRIDGTARYTLEDGRAGLLDLQVYASRSAVTMPYYGRATLTFRPPPAP